VIYRGVIIPVSAERALLGRSTPRTARVLPGMELAVADTAARPIDGAAALLGGWGRKE
jgi:hypothetical protein